MASQTRVQKAMVQNVKNNMSLFQNTNAVSRHSIATCDLGSIDQSNIWLYFYSNRKQSTVSENLTKILHALG